MDPASSPPPSQLAELWSRARVALLAPYLLAGGALLAGVLVLGAEIGRHIQGIDGWIAGLGPWALLAFFLLYAVLSSAFVPDILFGLVAGATFGFPRGLAAVAAGSLAGAALQYTVARLFLGRPIDRFLATRPSLRVILHAVRTDEFRLQFLIRLTPLNRALTSYLLGAAGVRFIPFVAACFALVPSLCLEVYAGYAGGHLARMAGRPYRSVVLEDVTVVAGLAAAVAVMVVVSRVARRALEAAAAADSATQARRS